MVEFQPVATQIILNCGTRSQFHSGQEKIMRLSEWYSRQIALLKMGWSRLREVIIEEESKLRREELLREIGGKQPQE
jgi:hypothetical protein